MSKMQFETSIFNFINKIHQLYWLYNNDKKQKQMQTQYQLFQNEELFDMSIELFKENLEVDDLQFQEYFRDDKFIAYIKCIEKIGIMLSKFYQQRETDLHVEIQTLTQKNIEFQQKITNEMELNQTLKETLDHFENERKYFDEKLNKSEHEIERSKHQILNELNVNEYLLKENDKLTKINNELQKQNHSLKLVIDDTHKKLNDSIDENKRVKIQLLALKKDLQKKNQECNSLKEENYCLQKDIESLQMLIEQKDYLLGNKVYKQRDDLGHSAEHNYPYFLHSIKAVKEENEEFGCDKEVLKDIEQEYKVQPVMALKFGDSRSISAYSEISQTSLHFQTLRLPNQSHNVSPIRIQSQQAKQRPPISERKRKDSSSHKAQVNKSLTKIQKTNQNKSQKKKANPILIPKFKQQFSKQKSLTCKAKRSEDSKQKLFRTIQPKNYSVQNDFKQKIKEMKLNASAIVNQRRIKIEEYFEDSKKAKIQHSQSLQDLSRQEYLPIENISFQKQLWTRQKLIRNLEVENRSVRELAFEESQKRNEAQHQYEELIERLKSELNFYKGEIRKVYSQFISEKALCKAYQDQFQKVSVEFEKQKQMYEITAKELKERCKMLLEGQILAYKQKYEQVLHKMKEMEARMLNSSKSSKEGSDQDLEQESPKDLKKCQSSSLFYKQVKHHPENVSQEFSEISNASGNHSKHGSAIIIDEEFQDEKQNGHIKIQDYEQDDSYKQKQFCDQELISYREDRQIELQHQETQTQNLLEQSCSRVSLEYSSKSLKILEQSQQSYEISMMVLKQSDQSPVKLTRRKHSIDRKLDFYRTEPITIWFQKQQISGLDTLQNTFKLESLNATEDMSQILKTYTNSLIHSSIISLKVNSQVQKVNQHTHTDLSLTLCPLEFIKIERKTLTIKNLQSHHLFNQTILPLKKQLTQVSSQSNAFILLDANCQTNSVEIQDNSTQTILKSTNNCEIQTNQPQFKIQSMVYLVNASAKKDSFEKASQYECSFKGQGIQFNFEKEVKEMSSQCIFSQKKTKKTQIKQKQENCFSQTLHQSFTQQSTVNQTIQPCQTTKNDHNQSFNQVQLDQVLLDMSQSFDMSDFFIETLKRKLLLIHQNLKRLEDDKSNDASSSGSGVEKAFKFIQMDMDIDLLKNQLISTVPKPQQSFFQGNVKTSKASTSCSISTSLSQFSPYRPETDEIKLKVAQFYQIKQIESENIDTVTRIEPQYEFNSGYENYSNADSVNRSPCKQGDLVLQELAIQNFNGQVEQFSSGKKLELVKKIDNSPKNQRICKQNSPSGGLSSPIIKAVKQMRFKGNLFDKPKELSFVSLQQFKNLCEKYQPKKMDLLSKMDLDQIRDSENEQKVLDCITKLSNKDMLVVYCKQNRKQNADQTMEDEKQQQTDIIIVNESKILSLNQNYMFDARKLVRCSSSDRLILGNHQIILTQSQLKIALKNKANCYSCHFPSHMKKQQTQRVKQKSFSVLKIYKYKFK